MRNALRQSDRTRILLIPALGLAAILLAGLVMHMLTEAPEANSYGLMADAFLHGRLDVSNCFDGDCVTFDDKAYVIFPPMPAVVAMPFVAIFGTGFHAFASIGFACFIATLTLWWHIFGRLGVERETVVWLLLALAFGSPLYYVSIHADRVWFFAQSINFLLLSNALCCLACRSLPPSPST